MNKTIAIIQARMGSTRFPGKMTKKLAGKSLLWHVINRAKQAKLIDQVIVATGRQPANLVLVKEAQKCAVPGYRGSETDVLSRYYYCAKKYHAQTIVRITGDCPLIDPQVIDQVIKLFQKSRVDYASNVHPPTYPDGLDMEVFSFAALSRAFREARLSSEREHVTPYIWKHPRLFTQVNLTNNRDLSGLRLTVDEPEDLRFLTSLVSYLPQNKYNLDSILKVITTQPQLLAINNKFIRNEGYAKSLKQDKIVKS